ncbi:MAG: alanine--tRNA ligase-related protein [Calditrichia bacterium]
MSIQTQQLYYKDPYQKEYIAKVLNTQIDGLFIWLLLDHCIFYPGGGGQYPDQGFINEQPLLEINKKGNEIWLKIENNSSLNIGDTVKTQLDWPFRYFNMQAHTAQHLLSGILFNQFNIKTVSVYFTKEAFAIEIDVNSLNENIISELISLANRKIRENKSVHVKMISKDKLDDFPIRRFPEGIEHLRTIRIEDVDWTACGGLHVKQLSEIQVIQHLYTEKIRGRYRLFFTCGLKALEKFNFYTQTFKSLRTLFTCNDSDIYQKVEQLQSELKSNLFQLGQLQSLLLENMLKSDLNVKDSTIKVVPLPDEINFSTQVINKVLNKMEENVIVYSYDTNTKKCLIMSNTGIDIRKHLMPLLDSGTIKGGGKGGFFQGKCESREDIDQAIKILHESFEGENYGQS